MNREGDGCIMTMVVLACLAMGFVIGSCGQRAVSEKEAVRQGKAEFYLDEKNERQWRWKPELIGPPLPPEKL